MVSSSREAILLIDQLLRTSSCPEGLAGVISAAQTFPLTLTVQNADGDEFVLVLELLREPDEVKRNWWPRYLTGLYAHHKVPIVLGVFCPDEATADWAARPIVMGTDFWASCEIRPLVLGPLDLPVLEGAFSGV